MVNVFNPAFDGVNEKNLSFNGFREFKDSPPSQGGEIPIPHGGSGWGGFAIFRFLIRSATKSKCPMTEWQMSFGI